MVNNSKKGLTREDITKNINSDYFILTPSGEEKYLDIRNRSEIYETDDQTLNSFIRADLITGQPKKEPPSIKKMRELELVDYEPASDLGKMIGPKI